MSFLDRVAECRVFDPSRYRPFRVDGAGVGANVVSHGWYITFQLTEGTVPRDLFRKILRLIDDLRRRPAPT